MLNSLPLHHLPMRFVLLVLIQCVGSSVLCAAAQSIPADAAPAAMFRNSPTRSGVFEDSGSGNYSGVLWRKQTAGAVRSSPIIAGGIVVIGSSDGNLYALGAKTGHEEWRFAADSAVASTAAIASGRVFFSSHAGTFYAVKFEDGTLLWKTRFGPDVPRAYEHETGEHLATYDGDFLLSSAAVFNDTVVVGGGDGFVYALNAQSGRLRWKFRTAGRVRSSPAVSQGIVYVGSYDGSLYAIAFDSGKLIWRYDTKGRSLNSADFGFDRRSILSSPSVSDGTVYVGSRDSHLYAIDAATGKLKWLCDYETNDNMTWAVSSPAVRGELVYMGTADGRFVHALRTADGRELWRFRMPGRVWSSPAIAGSKLYITDQSGGLYAVDANVGNESWHFQTGASIQSSPAEAGGMIYFGSNDGGVYAIRADGVQQLRRAVYWDAETARVSVGIDLEIAYKNFATVRDFFQARGYEVLSSSTVEGWLAGRKSDRAPSVVVFPTDILPVQLAGADPAHGPFRQYLDSGGKIVWLGDFPPLLLNLMVDHDTITGSSIRWDDSSKLLGIAMKGGLKNEFGNNQVTPAGRDWGLPDWWLGTWDLPPSNEMVALSLDDREYAGAWVKNYGGAPGTGFVYIGLGSWNGEMLQHLALLSEYRPR
jgi:eukaryotic-like serine/threonine-protein kinase